MSLCADYTGGLLRRDARPTAPDRRVGDRDDETGSWEYSPPGVLILAQR
jgi:hypothetical protein